MTLLEKIFTELWEAELNYKGATVNFFGIPRLSSHSQRSVNLALNRLTRQGIVDKKENYVKVTAQGRNYIQKKLQALKQFDKPEFLSKEKTLLLMFDIPSDMKAHRDWFRFHLKKFDYIMVQKSVWVGPNPLPKEFTEYLKKINLKDCIKTFVLAQPYKSNKR
jgi:CRISPR-associated endonuclease Cas2